MNQVSINLDTNKDKKVTSFETEQDVELDFGQVVCFPQDHLRSSHKTKSLGPSKVTRVLSPSRLLLQKKFKSFGPGEHVITNYGCSIMRGIMLQGMLYITDRNIYFYSPFNSTTIIGYGTKVTIPYL